MMSDLLGRHGRREGPADVAALVADELSAFVALPA
jgi:hypothetical protein